MNLRPSYIFLFAVLLSCSVARSADLERPNVLFIAIDDLNDWVGVFGGHPQVKTPNLDRFAAQGSVVFQNAHCAGPVCGPSRSALLSGFMPSTSGVYGNSQNMRQSALIQQHATLPEYFSKNGYHALSRGKIFHAHATASGRDVGQWAFDHWEPTKGGSPVDRRHVTSRNKNLINGKQGPPTKHSPSGGSEFAWGPTTGLKEETKDYQTALWAAEQLQKEYAKPFFIAIGLSRPHLPFYVPQEFFDLYDLATFKARDINEDDLNDILIKGTKRPKHKPSPDYLWLKQNGLIDECARAYAAASSYADACLGVIFEELTRSEFAENTIVVIWGDHGWHLGEKLRYRKATGWHESTRVPLIVRTPGTKDRQDSVRAVNLIDFYPTLIELCGLPAKSNLDGRSFAPLLENPDLAWDYPTVTVFGRGNASIHDERYHYMLYNDGTEEFYDLRTDPMEWNNLAQKLTPEQAAVRTRLVSFVPESFADSVPATDSKLKKTAKGMDNSIKATRQLDRLR